MLSLLVICLCALGVAQYYVNQPRFIEKIRTVFSNKFGGELTFSSMRLNLLRGVVVRDLQLMPGHGSEQQPTHVKPFLTLSRVSLEYSPWYLFRKKIKINNITVRKPHLNFVHHDDSWLLPAAQTNFIKQALTLSTGHNTFTILLDSVNLNSATISIRSTNAADELFVANDINLHGQFLYREKQGSAQGTLAIQNMRLGTALTLTNVSSQISYANDIVHFSELHGTAYGGAVEGAITIPTSGDQDKQTYGVYLNFKNIDFPSLVKDFKADPELMYAKIDFYCDLWGSMKYPSFVQGKGYFESKQVQLTGFKVLDIIGNLLNQPNLRNTKFDTVRGSFKIADDQLTFYSLEIISADLKISAAGTLKFDETIDFDALLTLNPALIKQIPPDVAEHFSTQPDGSKSISFKVSGQPDAPTSNLADKLYGKPPGQLISNPAAEITP